jgi:prepilin-type N-terminal cleavage/methylation domain-containing protein
MYYKYEIKQRGFTLIELLIVIVIIAALAVSVFIALNPTKRLQDARNARRVTDIESIRTAINTYIVDKGILPAGLTAGMQEMQIGTSNGTGVGANNVSCVNTTGSCNATTQSCVDISSPLATYLKSIPKDPKIGSASATGYSVSVDANNSVTVKSCGTEIATTQIACSGTSVNPSMNIQTTVNNAPSGTTFCFAAGTYANIGIAPKSGDIFDGNNQTAILDGGSTKNYAFYSGTTSGGQSLGSTANNVTVRGFVIQNYQTPLQDGAVESFGTTGWIIATNHITHNAASGIATYTGVQVLNNKIDYNGQEGYTAHGNNILYDGNEIAFNNSNLAVDPTWEAGGGKAWATQNATFRNNNVHDNGGPGMWDDTNNIYITYDHNTVTNNWGPGIYHEIGYDATITNNIVSSNGMPTSPGGGQKLGWLWDGGIQLRGSGAISSASPIIISGNIVSNNYNGISLLESPATGCTNTSLGEGAYGPCHIQNVTVQNNTITMSQGATGAVEDGEGPMVFTTFNNHFIGNTYHVINLTHPNDGYTYNWFAWNDGWPSWSSWKGYGNDTTGSFGL